VSEAKRVDALFREAVSAIDAGDVATLGRLLAAHPELVRARLASPGAWLRGKVGKALKGFFEKPYLLWFVAEDPVRNGTLPANIAQVARIIIDAAKREGVNSLQEQLDYALRLVGWSWIARQCHVQIELIDVLVDAGASPEGVPDAALVNGHIAAAQRLVERGATLTLATALCLERWDDVPRLAATTSASDKQMAFILSALRGNARALATMIKLGGVELNRPSRELYSHATALHHAVNSGSLEAVRVLVDAGADLHARDKAYDATPLGWAEHDNQTEIAAYLRAQGG
jgi:peptide-methionine (S)-S-oxide reductase